MRKLVFVYTFLLICCAFCAGCSRGSGNANSGRGNRGGGNSANQVEPSGSESPTPTPTPNQQEAVNKLVADLGTALAQGNADQLDQYLSDGYIHINDDGQIITKADILVGLRQGTIKFTSINFEEINTRVYGDSAVVTAGLFAVNSGGGKQVNLQDRVTLVAERENGTWRFVSGQMTPVHAVPQSGNSKGTQTGSSTATGQGSQPGGTGGGSGSGSGSGTGPSSGSGSGAGTGSGGSGGR